MSKLPDSSYSLKKPCAKCPFSKSIPPGQTGGSSPLVYIGQAEGPFWLPCHQASGFTPEGKCRVGEEIPQCAGAAIYRANVGVSEKMPEQLHSLPPDGGEKVFASHAELLAHHEKMSVEEAELMLAMFFPPSDLLALELRKQEVKRLFNSKKSE